ncbi:MAG: nucleotidyl transferase AbiEii/AbiGii toxin family protein [Clostridiales bacterium]|nr:nucleotidyl transferase AbiEii/AbiGii toxin family protein [Clostridiales bacterium]
MKLHLDKAAFRVLIDAVRAQSGIREDVLEKDYYVTLVLKELSVKQQEGLPAYFKGGTALYKALKMINRFSEDIDLSVDTRECSRSQSDKRLENATKKYSVLPRNREEGRTNRSEIITVYDYDPVTVYDENDALQRFGRLKIEATSFTISEPVESMEIAPMLYNYATDEQKSILESQYDVKPFPIMTISLERAYIDKLFAAEAYTRSSKDPHRAFEAAKHVYDLAVMAKLPRIQNLYNNDDLMAHLLDIRMEEESGRLDGIPGITPQEFSFFTGIANNRDVMNAYDIMQNQYVLRKKDRISFADAVNAISDIYKTLRKSSAWMHYKLPDALKQKTTINKSYQNKPEKSNPGRSK